MRAAPLALAITACSPQSAPEERIPVPSDASARYLLVALERTPAATLVATVRRESPEGTGTSRREFDCAARLARIAQPGTTLAPWNQDPVSAHIGAHVCARAR